MGQEAFGDYALSLLLSRTFFTVGDLGFGTWLVREVAQAREKAGHYFATLGVVRILTGIAVLLLLSGFLRVSTYDVSLRRHILLSGVAFFFIHLTSFIFNFFRAFENMKSEFEISVMKNILFLGLGVWAVTRRSLEFFYDIFIFSSVAALVVALVIYGRRMGWGTFRWGPLRLSGLFSIWCIQSIAAAYLYLGTVLLSFFRGIAEVGLYQAAYSFLEVLFVLSTILTTALFPVFSRLAKVSLQSLLSFYEETFRAVLFFFMPFGILALFGAKTLLQGFYGPSFQNALPALYILLSGSLFFIFGGIQCYLLLALGKEKKVLGIIVCCTCLNLVFNLWAIPRYGFLGASATTFLSEAVMFSLMLYGIIQTFGNRSFLEGAFFLWLLLGWTLFLFGWVRASFWIQLPVGLALYILLTAFFHRQLSRELRAVKTIYQELRA